MMGFGVKVSCFFTVKHVNWWITKSNSFSSIFELFFVIFDFLQRSNLRTIAKLTTKETHAVSQNARSKASTC